MKLMKTKFLILPALALAALTYSCNRTAGSRYVDLTTGEEIELVKDNETGLMVNATTRKPVYMYVDTETNDTIYGSTGKVINGEIRRLDDGAYQYTGDYKFKSEDKDGDYKVKVDDGEIKIKTDDQKIKIDEDGKKVKNDD
jgi:hypothetical protein